MIRSKYNSYAVQRMNITHPSSTISVILDSLNYTLLYKIKNNCDLMVF